MRSEIPPFLDWLMVGCGLVVIGLAVVTMATGNLKLTGAYTVSRDKNPGRFWAWAAAIMAIGLLTVITSLPRG